MLSKKYNSVDAEKKWQEYWRDLDIYKYDFESEKESFSIDTPPPTVSGSLHVGHIFSYTQAEMIARFQRMQGKNVFYPFGFDDNGLPTERLVEKEENIRAVDMPRSQFTERCLQTTKKYEEEFKSLWLSMGFSVDWNLQYETINPRVQKISQKSFIDMAKAGKAYIKESPVLWCTTCQTSIAQAELESTDLKTTFNYIPFLVEDEEELIVATTRPELLYSCVCIFVNPEDGRYLKYIGKTALVPLYNYPIPILSDEKVSLDKGTGVVMCATFGDITDVEWYEKYKLPYRKTIEANGRISEGVPFIGGLKVFNARESIIELLKEKSLLRKSEIISHTVSVHERCGNPIEIIHSKQWYINILNEKERYLEAAEEINWYPASMKNRYIAWVENLKWDWCISRQRYFGIPFPVWYCSSCGKVIFAQDHELPINPMETKLSSACSCGNMEFIAETAVLDTWATSSLTPLINSRWNTDKDITSKLLPMGMRTQAHEIIRTWAFYTIVRSLFHTGSLPWKDIMICGFVLAKKGEKISKSKNNAVSSPKELIGRHSADVLRYWAAGAKLGTDTMFSEDELKISKRFLTKLWNAASFCIMMLEDYKGETPAEIMPIDQWIIEKLKTVEAVAVGYLKQYETGLAKKEIDDFFWNDFCDDYLEIVKDRLYKPDIHGEPERLSAQYALYNVLLELIKLYAIYVPFITEEIYQAYFKDMEKASSIHAMQWNKNLLNRNEEILCFGENIKKLVGEVRKYKSENNLSLKESLQGLRITINESQQEYLQKTLKDIRACTWAENIEFEYSEEFRVEMIKAIESSGKLIIDN